MFKRSKTMNKQDVWLSTCFSSIQNNTVQEDQKTFFLHWIFLIWLILSVRSMPALLHPSTSKPSKLKGPKKVLQESGILPSPLIFVTPGASKHWKALPLLFLGHFWLNERWSAVCARIKRSDCRQQRYKFCPRWDLLPVMIQMHNCVCVFPERITFLPLFFLPFP